MKPQDCEDTVFYGSCDEARQQTFRAKFYYTGKPCKQGHDCVRYVSNTGCVMCLQAREERLKAERAGIISPEGPQPFVHILADWSPFVIIPPGYRQGAMVE